MNIWLVTRHPGALDWLLSRFHFTDAHIVQHLEVNAVQPGDRVVGTLPVQVIADISARAASYYHLTIPMRSEHRGRELSADDLDALGARLECFHVERRPRKDLPSI